MWNKYKKKPVNVKPQTIYLHIGRGKTGTTTIQNYLRLQQKFLLSKDIHYISAGGGSRGTGHHDFAKSFISVLPHYMVAARNPQRDRKLIKAEIEGSNSQNIILSSENFELADPLKVYEFSDSLKSRYNIKIIFFVRSQDELAESEYNQIVKLKKEIVSFNEYINKYIEGCNFMETASKWEKYFGLENMICKIFDGSKRDIIHQFLSCISKEVIDPEKYALRDESISKLNISLGYKALTIVRLLNSVNIKNRTELYGTLNTLLSTNDLPALLFNSVEASKYRSKFAESNRAFTERYIGKKLSDLGGRRYSDEERTRIRDKINALSMDSIQKLGEQMK